MNAKELNKIKIFCIVGFAFVCVFGSLSHFFYAWSGYDKVVGILFPANESTWEHLKLAIFPTFLYFLFGMFFIKNKNFILSFFVILLIPMLLIPSIFYSYTAITGQAIIWVDILSYFVSVFVAFVLGYLILKSNFFDKKYTIIAIIGILVILICYLTFTISPLQNFLFKDFTDNSYGLKQLILLLT